MYYIPRHPSIFHTNEFFSFPPLYVAISVNHPPTLNAAQSPCINMIRLDRERALAVCLREPQTRKQRCEFRFAVVAAHRRFICTYILAKNAGRRDDDGGDDGRHVVDLEWAKSVF